MANSLKPWRAFTVFVSSTFIDMEAERDYLNNIVARELEREYEKKRVSLSFVDLRWGVQTDKDAGKEVRELSVLNVCMEEIKRSRPFFIALLGHRYGWVPPKERFQKVIEGLDEEERLLLKDGEGASVTALEILFGALGDESLLNRSLFYFRDAASYAMVPEEELPRYQDRQHADKLERLKERIVCECRKKGLDNVHSYSLEWHDGTFTRLEEWGEQVKRHLRREIDAELEETAASTPATWLEMEDLQQDIFFHARTQLFVGRQEELAVLEHFARHERGVMVVAGFPTMGKSALLCQLYQRLQGVPGLVTLLHCTRVSRYADYTYRMFCRLSARLCAELGQPYAEPAEAGNEARNYFLDLVRRVTDTGRKVVLLIDSTDAFRSSDDASNYSWLPDEACSILTCERTQEDGYVKEVTLYKENAQVMYLPFLRREEARVLAREQCRLYHKSIPESVLALILDKKADNGQSLPEGYPKEYYACFDPLWVKLMVRLLVSLDENDFTEARQMADETDEETKLEKYLCQCVRQAQVDPTNLIIKSFLPKIMQGIDISFLYKVLMGIALSYRGLGETDMAVLFGKEWDSLSFSKIHHYLKDVLVEDYENGVWWFGHVRVAGSLETLISEKHYQAFVHNFGSYYVGQGSKRPEAARKAMYFLLHGNRPALAAYACSSLFLEESERDEMLEEMVENIKADNEKNLPWFISMFSQRKADGQDVSAKMWNWMERGGYQRLYQMAIECLLPRLACWKKGLALQFAQGIEPVVRIYADSHPDDSTIDYLLRELCYRMADYSDAMGELEQQKEYAERLAALKPGSVSQAGMAAEGLARVAMNEGDYPKAEQLYLSVYQEGKKLYEVSPNDPEAAYEAFMGCLYLIDVYRRWENQDRLAAMVEEAFAYLPLVPSEPGYQKIKGQFYHIAGSLYDNLGRGRQALELLEKSVEVLTAIHEGDLRNDEYATELGIAYEALGAYYEKRNQADRALECYRKQAALFDEVLAIDGGNEECRHFRLIAACHLWDVLRSRSDKKDEWREVNNELVWLGRQTVPDLLTDHDLLHIASAYFFLGVLWKEQSPEERSIQPQDMFDLLLEGWYFLRDAYHSSREVCYAEFGQLCLYYRFEIAEDNGLPTEEPLETLLEAYSGYPLSDSDLGQLLSTWIQRLQTKIEQKQGGPFVQAFQAGQYAEAIRLYQDEASHAGYEQFLYALCLLRAGFRKKAAEAFAALRGGVQDDRESWLLVTVNLGVCHLLGGDVQAFHRLFDELSAEEKAMQKPAFLWKACVEREALAASGRPWHKRLFGVRPSAEELRVTLPQPYGWTEL